MALLPPTVYLLCAATSGVCASLLVRHYRRNRTKILLWTALCFVGLAVNNALLVVDVLVLPTIDLIMLRQIALLSAVGVLLYGFIWELD